MSSVLIVNASPLVFLGNAGRLDLLQAIGSRVVVPQAVFDEVTQSRHCDRASAAVREAMWLEPLNAASIPSSVNAWNLGPGESEVLALGVEYRDARLVIDDLAGRKCGLSLGLDVVGTLGVVIAAHRRGIITDAHAVMTDLRASGMWISDAVITRALAIARDGR